MRTPRTGLATAAMAAGMLLAAARVAGAGSLCTAFEHKLAGSYGLGLANCHARAVRRGEPLDPTCREAQDARLALRWAQATRRGDCFALGDETATAARLNRCLATLAGRLEPLGPQPSVCTAAKYTAAGRYLAARARCRSAAARGGRRPDPACVDRARGRLARQWAAAEAKGDCLTSGDATDVQSLLESCEDQAAALLGGPALCGEDGRACPPMPFGTCASDPSTRVTVGYFPVATPLGDCLSQPRKCVPGADAWRLVRTVTMENDYVRITFADGGGGKVFDFRRKVDESRDCADWDGCPGGNGSSPPPPTTDPADDRYPPDASGRRWLLRDSAPRPEELRCDSRPTNPGVCSDGTTRCTLANRATAPQCAGCVPRCEWAYFWGDPSYDPRNDPAQKTTGVEIGTPHFVHNIVGTGSQYSVALRDREESKESCLLGDNWNPNSMGTCDGSANGGCYVTQAQDCPYGQSCSGPPLGDNCDLDRDRWTGTLIVSRTREPFRLRDPLDPGSGNEAFDHPRAPAPMARQVGAHRVYLRTGMWRSFAKPVNDAAPLCAEMPPNEGFCPDDNGNAFCAPELDCPFAAGYVGKAYWNDSFTWRAFDGGPFCRDPQGEVCQCGSGGCEAGSYTSADVREWFDTDRSQAVFDAWSERKDGAGCPAGAALCNPWPKEPGWERPFPDLGLGREDVWAESYVCLQGPEAIFQLRVHHPADAARHGAGHPLPGHALPQAHARGLFEWAIYGDRGVVRRERIPPEAPGIPKKLYDTASDRWIGMLSDEEVYGLFLYEDFDLGTDAAGFAHGRIDRQSVRTSDAEGNKVKLTSNSYRFTARDSVLDVEYRYALATPAYMAAHAACYNRGLPYPCGVEDATAVAADGPELWTWQHNLTGERWSRYEGDGRTGLPECGPAEVGDGSTACWFRLDFVDALLPLHEMQPPGTADVYECREPRTTEPGAPDEHFLAVCPASEPGCPDPCASAIVEAGPIGRVLLGGPGGAPDGDGPERRALWERTPKVDFDGDGKRDERDRFADTVNPDFKPDWECTDASECRKRSNWDCATDASGLERCGYDPDRDGLRLGFLPPGPTLAVWTLEEGGSGRRHFAVTTTGAPDAGWTHVGDLGMLLGSAPTAGINPALDPVHPHPPIRPPTHPLYLCRDPAVDCGGEPCTFVSAERCADLVGRLGLAYSVPLGPEWHAFGDAVYTVEAFRCRHTTDGDSAVDGWAAVAGDPAACEGLGAGWTSDGSLGHVAAFAPAG